ncbi:hypothetical protein H6G76_31880 [Nostoc sp. FACHB-152]|uniref:condensation domain-containing protein n=1 Tax=unclassified Nostoc TaxID=2593658 RepID=UPI00168951EF|nr:MULTISPECIES: condensation domain-containing protein [unclassified Nostoc]MBD2451640.1 hypothetical protein [Nostoc sp. FACHB-152]MBD2472776.1 hypothetical protein [Nostoc sp. FACHB-145]
MNNFSRKLGLVENLFEILHDFGALIDVNAVRISGLLKPDILQQALELVQKHHPMLQVHIVDLEDGVYFQSEGTAKIPLRVLEKQNDNQWLNIAEEELHKKFSRGLDPLCRVTLIYSNESKTVSEIIATFHHAITDGMSCMNFIHEILTYYQQIAESYLIEKVVTMPLLPPIENLINQKLNVKNLVEDEQRRNINEQNPELLKLIIEREAPYTERRTCLLPRYLSKDNTLLLFDRCKQEATTVHGILCAAMLFGISKLTLKDKPVYLSCGSNINLRKYCNPIVNDDYIGCFISLIDSKHTLSLDTNLWDLARECKLHLNNSINNGVHLNKIDNENIKNINHHIILQMAEYEMGRSHSVSISNRGKSKWLSQTRYDKLVAEIPIE